MIVLDTHIWVWWVDESPQLPGTFHRDPADQIIVATARVHDLPVLTMDRLRLNYPHVRTL